MSLENGGHLTWRWIDVEVPASEFSTYSPTFRYQNKEWILECRGSSDGADLVIQLNLLSFTLPLPPQQRQSSFEVSLLVFRGRDANRGVPLRLTCGVSNDPGTQLLWQRAASEVEHIFPEFSGDRALSFRIQFTEQNLQRGLQPGNVMNVEADRNNPHLLAVRSLAPQRMSPPQIRGTVRPPTYPNAQDHIRQAQLHQIMSAIANERARGVNISPQFASSLATAHLSTLNRYLHPEVHSKTFADASVQTDLTADSISCLDALSADFGKLLDVESGADLEIECDGHTTRAHKGVLCSRSPVFAGMLQSGMLEQRTGVINVQDVDADTLRKFINFLYTGKLDEELTHEAAVSLYEAADMYGVETLSRSCSQLLVQNLTVDNACNLLAVADAHGDEDLKRGITPYILEEKIPQSGERWQAFCKSHPLLANEVLNQYVDYISGSEGPSKKRRAS